MINRHVSRWLDLPISTCVAEFLELPRNQGGLGITSLKSTAEKLRLGLRLSLKLSEHDDLKNIWSATQKHNFNLDSFSNKTDSKKSAYASLKSAQQQKNSKSFVKFENSRLIAKNNHGLLFQSVHQ